MSSTKPHKSLVEAISWLVAARRRGLTVTTRNSKLYVTPPNLITDADREIVKRVGTDIRALVGLCSSFKDVTQPS